MRFVKGKEAERIIRKGVRTLSAEEKRRLGLSATNTYYVRQDLKRLTRRVVLISSRQARQARERLGIERSVVAQRALGKAGRKPSSNGVIQRNRDYIDRIITFEQARQQFIEIAKLARVHENTLARIIAWRREVEWYVRVLKDGNKQCVLTWKSDEGFGVVGGINHLIQIVESLYFFLVGYSAEVVAPGRWTSSVTVEKDVAVSEIATVRRIVTSWKAGEDISEEDLDGVYLFDRLIQLLASNYDQTAIIYTFVVRLTWRGEE